MVQMPQTQGLANGKPVSAPVEKLVEYRTSHYSATSESSSYHTNHPAQVQFRFANPIICRLTAGYKVISVGNSAPFGFDVGDALYVPPGMEIDIDLGAATPENPIECDCFEIEAGRMESLIARLNENLSASGQDVSVVLNWTKFAVFAGDEADSLRLDSLMEMFSGAHDLVTGARIEARIDETVLSVLQMRSKDLLIFDKIADQDSGVLAAARLIRNNLGTHLSSDVLAQTACMSNSSLHRHFQRQFGTSPRKFANQLRISEAKRLLRRSNASVEKIASGLAFADASHFTRVFRASVGETPAQYRKRRLSAYSFPPWE